MKDSLRVASVCRGLPSAADPSSGVFVLRRLEALARFASVETIQPVPYFPGLKPIPEWARSQRAYNSLVIRPESMFYVPKVLKSLDGRWLERAVLRGLKRLRQRAPVDLVDAHFGYPEGVGSFLAARRLGLPVFITVRGLESEYLRKPLIGRQIERAIRLADGCICVSYSLQKLVLEHGAEPQRTTVIHNAIDASTFCPGDKAASRATLGLGADGPVVVSVGQLISRKRHHITLTAFARVRRRFPSARLVIVGGRTFESRYPRMLRNLAAELGIEDAVSFVGDLPPEEVAVWLRAADVFALATQREGCCNAVLEALACGLPVVTTPVGDNAHFVRDGENGFLVQVDSVDAMVSALEQALRSDWDHEAISAKLGVGGWDRVAQKVVAFFRERLETRSGGRVPESLE